MTLKTFNVAVFLLLLFCVARIHGQESAGLSNSTAGNQDKPSSRAKYEVNSELQTCNKSYFEENHLVQQFVNEFTNMKETVCKITAANKNFEISTAEYKRETSTLKKEAIDLQKKYDNLLKQLDQLQNNLAVCNLGKKEAERAHVECEKVVQNLTKPRIPCPEDWLQINEKYFKLLSNDLVTYPEGKEGCLSLNPAATLITIESQKEQDAIEDLIFNRWKLSVNGRNKTWVTGAWLDAVLSNRRFTSWIDGTPMNYTNFASREPNLLAVEFNLHLIMASPKFRGQWNNAQPTFPQLAICQVKVVNCSPS